MIEKWSNKLQCGNNKAGHANTCGFYKLSYHINETQEASKVFGKIPYLWKKFGKIVTRWLKKQNDHNK